MTLFLLDASRYQVERPDPLDLESAHLAGFSLVNIALSGGNGYVSGAWAGQYADRARALGMGVCCYHYLHGRSSGAEQAAFSLRRIADLGAVAHQVDVEDPSVTYAVWRDYVNAVQDGLGRHVLTYTGDWYWQPRGWPGAELTPFLMAQPNAGKQPIYPGDDSPHWLAGYGGWPELSVMQYRIGKIGTVDCSLSAIRDPNVWTALTGGEVTWFLNAALTTMRNEVNARWPNRDKGSDGTIGDAAHASRSSDHNPDPDGSVDAWDMDVDLRSGNDPAAIEFLKSRFQAHPASSYWIHNDNICRRADNWLRRSYPEYLASKGIDPGTRNTHTHHVHWNSREEFEDSTQPWGIEVKDVELSDKLSNGSTLDGILVTIYNRTDYLANKLGLAAKLDAILAAAVDDGNTTVTMSPEDRAALAAALAEVVHVPTVEDIGTVVDRELDEQSRAGADTD